MVFSVLGKTMVVEAILLCFPLLVGVICAEHSFLSYLIPILGLVAAGLPLSLCLKPKDKSIYAKEGFIVVALVWIIFSLFGALPFVISGQIPNYVDALFETVSGFTTTGASILSDVESLSKSAMFWRVFTHWIGGMGVLVFVLAILPDSDAGLMHIFRAESPGPSVGKLVSKIKLTARILYGIYITMTVLECILLLIGGMSFYDSLLHAFSTAGTGGFGIKNTSVAYYDSVYVDVVIAIFMFLFGVNFNVYYFILIRSFAKAFKSEELLTYIIIVFTSTLVIAINILSAYGNFWNALRYSFFQVTSISSSTGFSTANFDTWPALSKGILMFLAVVGASAGSTGGGMKVSRLIILLKSGVSDVRRMVRPRFVTSPKFEGESVGDDILRNVRSYFVLWFTILVAATLLLCIDPFGDIFTNFTATLACIGNVGPGFNLVGPACNYGGYSPYAKLLLSFVMLAGRLEIFPMLILFSPSAWKKR